VEPQLQGSNWIDSRRVFFIEVVNKSEALGAERRTCWGFSPVMYRPAPHARGDQGSRVHRSIKPRSAIIDQSRESSLGIEKEKTRKP